VSETYSSYKRDLLVALLEEEDRKAASPVDVANACDAAGLMFNEEFVVRFINQERGVLGEGAGVLDFYSFELNSTGRNLADQISKSRGPKSLIERITSETSQRLINALNFGVAVLALVIAAIALWNT